MCKIQENSHDLRVTMIRLSSSCARSDVKLSMAVHEPSRMRAQLISHPFFFARRVARASASKTDSCGPSVEGEVVVFRSQTVDLRLGVVVGAMCTHRFVLPATLQVGCREDTVQVDSSAEPTQVLEEDVLAVLPPGSKISQIETALEEARQRLCERS